MNELELEKLNAQITYPEGKIFWEHNKGYTSELLKKLHKQGFTTVKSGSIHYLKDKEGNVLTHGYSWEGYLFNIAKAMQ